jgi:hypothetical protein
MIFVPYDVSFSLCHGFGTMVCTICEFTIIYLMNSVVRMETLFGTVRLNPLFDEIAGFITTCVCVCVCVCV